MKKLKTFFRKIRARFRKRTQEVQKVERKHRKLILTLVAIGILFVLFLTTKTYLYLNFILGNDIVVSLDADKENLYLQNGESENITIETSVTANPFCKTQCTAYLEDLSAGEIIDEKEFQIRPGLPYETTYDLNADRKGQGQKIYRFGTECSAVQTLFCHTDKDPTKRSLIITLDHTLNAQERALKEKLQEELEEYTEENVLTTRKLEAINETADVLAERVILDEFFELYEQTKTTNMELTEQLKKAEILWNEEKYEELSTATEELPSLSFEVRTNLNNTENNIRKIIDDYNLAISDIIRTKELIESVSEKGVNATTANLLDKLISDLNSTILIFTAKTSIGGKSNTASAILASARSTVRTVKYENNKFALSTLLENDIFFSLLCQETTICITRPSLEYRTTQELNIQDACNDRETLLGILSSLNGTTSGKINQTMLDDTLQAQKHSIFLAIPENKTHTELAKKILSGNKENQTYLNITTATHTLITNPPEECTFINQSLAVPEFNFQPLIINQVNKTVIPGFSEQPDICCTFGRCSKCCIGNTCSNDTTPIIFLHGHAFNKDTSAEYSLDGFNKIQDSLESEGMLNLGAISLYTDRAAPYGVWGRHNVPVSLKISYYFDLFEEPENYIVVQTKSENIDTYAVRLKELLDTVERRTGRDEFIIVAHSMGGLVTRRYMQIFGHERVSKLIMIGTPNHGVEGNVADFCGWIGEQLECRDMKKDSLFLNKLNRQDLPPVEIHNIIGVGCEMDETTGDGIVKKSNAELQNTHLHYVNGTCSTFEKLHTEMLDPAKHPETLKIILEVIDE